jgi:hypothetical protein
MFRTIITEILTYTNPKSKDSNQEQLFFKLQMMRLDNKTGMHIECYIKPRPRHQKHSVVQDEIRVCTTQNPWSNCLTQGIVQILDPLRHIR